MTEKPPEQERVLETDRLFAYHEKTKHSYISVRTIPHLLDWANQPNPFRIYHGAEVIPLPPAPPFPEASPFRVMASLIPPPEAAAPPRHPPVTLSVLSQLLYHSMALSAWKKVKSTGFLYSLRVNPSSGNLHPTETYLAIRAAGDVPDGLYHYRVRDHALERRRGGNVVAALAGAAGIPWAASAPLVLVLTSVLWRESWKYRDRAYRYCLHDMGHAAASLLIAARALSLAGRCIGHFPDSVIAEVVGVDPLSEAPLLLLVLGADPRDVSSSVTQPPHEAVLGPLEGVPNQLSPEEVPYYLLTGMHQSTFLPSQPGPCPSPSGGTGTVCEDGIPLPRGPIHDAPLDYVVRTRRSALDFDPGFSITIDALGVILAHATADFPADFRGNLSASGGGGEGISLIHLYLYVHRVRGLTSGVYRYHARSHRLEPVKEGDHQEQAAHLSLEQALAGHSVVTFSMIADLEGAARAFGNRGYRYAHCEAGAIGQRLYIGAEALGFNATGIGAFYDDEVHHYLGIPRKMGQVIYHFAIGRAVRDDRLVTLAELSSDEALSQATPDLP